MNALDAQRDRIRHVAIISADQSAAMLLAWQRNARTALEWVHPSWSATAFGCDEAAFRRWFAAAGERCDEACSLALLRMLLPQTPSFERLNASVASRLDALPVETGLRGLRLYALLFRRAEVRRLIDRDTRKRLAQWIGCPLDAFTRLAALDMPSSPDLARASQAAAVPALDTLDADQLAHEGYARFAHDSSIPPCPLLRLALPREVPQALHWLHAVPAHSDAQMPRLLQTCMKELLPEYPWLSG
jgi:type III secretion system HrpB4-like protein